ncbi:MAG: PIN domain-containing protein [Longimicrobiales bacterium]|nr:PIN domain-containing protein [Longimicrobiales bacterium]
MKTWLVDTGPIVAYLDAADPAHSEVAQAWDAFTGRLVTSSAVVTEAMHFVAPSSGGPRYLASLVVTSGMDVHDLTRPPELHEAVALMEQYADTPMDFADATLVLLAEAFEIEDVFTLDRCGFAAYRTRPGRALRSVLDMP